MLMVMPRAFSSGALSIDSYARYDASFFIASTLVMAAVKVVLPWSMCPIVPTFTCGLLRSNFSFAILGTLRVNHIWSDAPVERHYRRNVSAFYFFDLPLIISSAIALVTCA